MKHLGCGEPVDILRLTISLDQFFITGHMCQHTKLDLGIIGIQKYKSLLRHKNLTDQPAQLHADRYVLKIRICTADTTGCCDRLIESRVDPSIFSDHISETICISGFQLGQLAVLQDIFYDGMIRRQLIQDIRRCGIAGLGLLSTWKSQLFKKDHTQLFRGIDIKLLPCFLPDGFFQLLDTDFKFFTIALKLFTLNGNPPFFHGIQGKDKRKLDLIINLTHACFIQFFKKNLSGHAGHKRLIAGIISKAFLFLFPGLFQRSLSKKVFL